MSLPPELSSPGSIGRTSDMSGMSVGQPLLTPGTGKPTPGHHHHAVASGIGQPEPMIGQHVAGPSRPEAMDPFFAGVPGILKTYDFDYDAMVEFDTESGFAGLVGASLIPYTWPVFPFVCCWWSACQKQNTEKKPIAASNTRLSFRSIAPLFSASLLRSFWKRRYAVGGANPASGMPAGMGGVPFSAPDGMAQPGLQAGVQAGVQSGGMMPAGGAPGGRAPPQYRTW